MSIDSSSREEEEEKKQTVILTNHAIASDEDAYIEDESIILR